MSVRVVVNFRDGTKREWPDPASRVISSREYVVSYKDGVMSIGRYEEATETFPLDLVGNVYEEPRARF